MKGNQDFSVAGFHPDAGIAGDVLVGGDGTHFLAVRIQDGPAGQVLLSVFVQVVVGIDGPAGQFVGIRQVVDAGQADEGCDERKT